MKKFSDAKLFCNNVKALRLIFNLTKREMAEKLGISVGALTTIENGELPKRLDVNIVLRLHECFGLTPSEVFEYDVCDIVRDILKDMGYGGEVLLQKQLTSTEKGGKITVE